MFGSWGIILPLLLQASIDIDTDGAEANTKANFRALCEAHYSPDRCRTEFLTIYTNVDDQPPPDRADGYVRFRTSIAECEAYGNREICADLLEDPYDEEFPRLQGFWYTIYPETSRSDSYESDAYAQAACSLRNSASGAAYMSTRVVDFPYNRNFENHIFTHVGILNRMMALPGPQVPTVLFYDDSDGANALALNYKVEGDAQVNPDWVVVGGGTRTVLLGVNLINEFSIQSGPTDLNTAALQSIIAHEFGHIAQYHIGVRRPVKTMELMADFMSGWYLGTLGQVEGNTLSETNLRIAMESTYRIGDFNYTHPNHHGTPDERLAAFMRGVEESRRTTERDYWLAFDRAKAIYN